MRSPTMPWVEQMHYLFESLFFVKSKDNFFRWITVQKKTMKNVVKTSDSFDKLYDFVI